MPSVTSQQLNKQLDSALWPFVESLTYEPGSADEVRLQLQVPEGLSYFAGHFPTQAVLPGVVQVHWVGELAKRFFDVGRFIELKSVKFNGMVLPNTELTLVLRFDAVKGLLRFDYHTAAEKLSSGALSFSTEA